MKFDMTGASAPIAEKRPLELNRHGITRVDDYAWLRADNWQQVMREPDTLDKDIRAYLEAENTYQKTLLADTEQLQKKLVAEMRGRIKEDDSSVPMKDGPWAYGGEFEQGAEHPKYTRERLDGSEKTVILDGDAEARGKSYFRLASPGHSPDHQLLSWGYDDKGSEFYTIRFRDLPGNEDRQELIEDTGGGGTFSRNSDYFIYSRLDENHRPSRLFVHKIGDTSGEDTLIYEEPDAGMFMGAGKTQSGDWIIIDSHDHETSQAWLLPADDPFAEKTLIAERQDKVEYSPDEGGGVLYILTNRDGARDFKIAIAPVDAPGPENWTDLVPHKPGRLILSHGIYKRHLIWLEREDGLPRIVIHRLGDGEQHEIAFDEEAYALGLGGSMEFDTDIIRFTYSSMTTPSQTFDYNMETRERTLLKVQEVPSGHDPNDYVTRRIFARAKDGEEVPISLVYHKDTKLDGSAPCLLYGYGSYGMSMPAGFSTNCLSLVDRGFVYAIAHIRGGKEKGFDWYEQGKKDKKTNTFTDFIACAGHLIKEGFTGKGKIVAQGGSAGGMLMGAVANMAPELFAGIIAEVPFVDVLNTMLDDSLPLTPPEWPEWGNPIASKEDYETIATYSPYDQVTAKAYPPILAVAGLTDPRVTYWEPAKWVAKLRAHQQGEAPILLKTNMGAGHAGASGRFARLDEIAVTYAFAIKVAGLEISA